MKLIVIEGVDGAGKSTQIKLLKEHFVSKGYDCAYLHFPRTEAPYFGELIARFLRGELGSLSEVDPYIVAMLYAGDRKDAAPIIQNWLKEGKVVLLDRYTYSNIAYQCAKLHSIEEQNRLADWIFSLEFNHFSIPLPDLNIFLDVPSSFTEKKLKAPRTGNERDYLCGARDIHEENLDFQRKVRETYLRVSQSDERLAVVNCDNEKGEMATPKSIFEKILKKIKKKKIFL
jgi:dTMP kinase